MPPPQQQTRLQSSEGAGRSGHRRVNPAPVSSAVRHLTSVETHTSSTRSLQTLTHDSGRLHAWRLLAKATPSLRPRPEEHRLVVPICLEYEAPNQIIGPAVREDLILKLRHEVRQYMEDRNTRLRPVDLPCDVAIGELSGSHVYAASTCVRVGASIAGASWVGWARS